MKKVINVILDVILGLLIALIVGFTIFGAIPQSCMPSCEPPKYYGTYYGGEFWGTIEIGNKLKIGDKEYNYKFENDVFIFNDPEFIFADGNGDVKYFYYENDKVLSLKIISNPNIGKIKVRDGFFQANLIWRDGTTNFSYNFLSNGTVIYKGSVGTMNGNYSLVNGVLKIDYSADLIEYYYIDLDFNMHCYIYVKTN